MTKKEAAIESIKAMVKELEALGLDEHDTKIVEGVGIANNYCMRAIDALNKTADQLTRCGEW